MLRVFTALLALVGCDGKPEPLPTAHDGVFLRDTTVVALGATSRFDVAGPDAGVDAAPAGPGDAWFGQFDLDRNEVWQTVIGTAGYERLERLIELADGRIAAVGQAPRDAMGVPMPAGWIVVLDPDGAVSWQRTFDTAPMSAVGELASGDLVVTAGGTVMVMSPEGVVRWAKRFDTVSGLDLRQVVPGRDGGFLVIGREGDLPSQWLAVMDADGAVEWQRRLATDTFDMPMDAIQTSDGGWAIAATAADFLGGERDWWFLKMNTRGDLVWQVSLQTDFDDVPVELRELSDQRILVVGHTTTFATLLQEELDLWFVILTAAGQVDDQRALGGIDPERALAVGEPTPGDFRVLGTVVEQASVAEQATTPEQVSISAFSVDGFVAGGGGCSTERTTNAFARALPVEQQTTVYPALDQPVTSAAAVAQAETPATLPAVVCR